MAESGNKTDIFQLGLLALVVLLLLTNVGLFLRMNRFQAETLAALRSLGSAVHVGQNHEGLSSGVVAPAFALKTLNGNEVSLEGYAGSRVLLVFVATQCGACERVYPMLRQLSETRGDWEVLMVSEGSAEEILAIMESQQLFFPVAPWNEDLARAYQVAGTPFCTVIDESGRVTGSGFVTNRQNLDALLLPN